MGIHQDARTTPHSRAAIVAVMTKRSERITDVARALGISPKTGRKRMARARAGDSLADRSRPRHVPRATPAELVAEVEWPPRQRWMSAEIAERLRAPVPRYHRARAGDSLHLAVTKLGRIGRVGHRRITGDRTSRARGIGWMYVHEAIDDAPRAAYADVLPAERGAITARAGSRWTAPAKAHRSRCACR
jgi:transposase-like protein